MEINIVIIGLIIIAVGVSVILHEVVHGYVAKYLGDNTAKEEGRLTLNPIVHIHPIFTLALPVLLAILGQPIFGAAKPVPVHPGKLKGEEFGMALVAVAGPLTNLLLAILMGILIGLFNIDSGILRIFGELFISVNVGFFIFNMIPVPPLDGSRVLYVFAPEPLQKMMQAIEPFGIFILLGLVLAGFPIIGNVISSSYELIINFIVSLT